MDPGGGLRAFVRDRDPRAWSNDLLRAIGSRLVSCESLLNVSGWLDSDKEGGRYRDYFPHVKRYEISNHPNDAKKGLPSGAGVPLDLEGELPADLVGAFDFALHHTVLEHVRNPWRAFANVVRVSRIGVISVVPFKQALHFEAGNFGDYFRFSPMGMRELHKECGLLPVFEACGLGLNTVYLLYVGVRPTYANQFPIKQELDLAALNHGLGRVGVGDVIGAFVARLLRKVV
jgi:hypothetical protein